ILITASIHQIPAASIPASLGIYLIAWGIFTAIMTYAATKIGSMPVLSVFVLLTITYFVLGIGAWGGLPGISVIGGYVGILTAIAAWYASATMVYGSLPK
ncbi:MAG: GPR1/FUN34/YaaH family transporter, partial [Candidatus Binataceae bacterium]